MEKAYFTQDEKKESDSVKFPGMSGSFLDETIDGTTMAEEEMDLIQKLTKSGDDVDRSRRSSNRSKRKTRRKRGDSLEREISQLILSTASSGATDAHFEVLGRPPSPINVDSTSVNFILQDLVHLDEERSVSESSIRSSRALSLLANDTKPLDPEAKLVTEENSKTDLPRALPSFDQATSPEYADPPLDISFSDGEDITGAAEPQHGLGKSQRDSIPALSTKDMKGSQKQGHDFAPVESFESICWKEDEVDPIPVGSNRALSPVPLLPTKQDPPTNQSAEVMIVKAKEKAKSSSLPSVIDNRSETHKSTRGKVEVQTKTTASESVIFKTNFDEWTPFEPMEASRTDMRFSDTLVDPMEFEENDSIDENGFLLIPPQRTRKVPKLRAPTANKRILLESRSKSSELRSPAVLEDRRTFDARDFGSFHPDSPDSVFDYPSGVSQKSSRSYRSDPPSSQDLQFLEYRATRLAI